MNDPLGKLSWDDLRIIKRIGEGESLALVVGSQVPNKRTFRRVFAQLLQMGLMIFHSPPRVLILTALTVRRLFSSPFARLY
jgi:hypothetical protein